MKHLALTALNTLGAIIWVAFAINTQSGWKFALLAVAAVCGITALMNFLLWAKTNHMGTNQPPKTPDKLGASGPGITPA